MPCDLILALDLETKEEAHAFLKRVGPDLKTVKIGLQLFTRYGPPLVEEVAALGYRIFLDLKLHDIPNTVAKAVQSLAALPISMLTIHAFGGAGMMAAAHRSRATHCPELTLLAVTVLTSMDAGALREVGITAAPEDQVLRLARLAAASEVNGIVCSPLETALLRRELGPDATLVTPGIRPADSASDEQKRIMTPRQAAEAGASFIVVGRPILRAADPAAAVRSILSEIS
jgi:orotidine-5'-phosphate decarboxylase